MEATKVFSSPVLHLASSSSFIRQRFFKNWRYRNHVGIIAKAGGKPNENECWGDLVGSKLIVLRKRIKDLHMEEERTQPPRDWTEWEKKYYISGYNEDVFEAMGILQNYLISVRPGLALRTVALVVLSLLMSFGMVLFHVLQLVKSM